MRRKICFLTGTRADYGKIKPLMRLVEKSNFELYVFVTGMHMHKEFGSTYREVEKDGYSNIFKYINQRVGMTPMDVTLSSTISGFSNYVREIEPNMIVVHGDRLEALAGAVVGAMNNILVAHIEGGEVSGTIDESLRHAITKLAHIHYVANKAAKQNIIQLGEIPDNIFVIGSPDIDIMLGDDIPQSGEIQRKYNLPFEDYALVLYHPVTTSYKQMRSFSENFVSAILESDRNYIVVHPNNDFGRDFIIEEYQRLSNNKRFAMFPSVRFEYFLGMLKNAQLIVGNSSAGVREACVYGTPSVDVGDRQSGRYKVCNGILHCECEKESIINAIETMYGRKVPAESEFGKGNSAQAFMDTICIEKLWGLPVQKQFVKIS